MIIAGNKKYGLAKELLQLYPDAICASRSTGFDLTLENDRTKFSELCLDHDTIVLCSALYNFNQTLLLDSVFKICIEKKFNPHIICVGSTTDRVTNSKPWLYNSEKKSLRDYSNTLALSGVWTDTPKISYISFGTLTNNQHKHPERKCMDISLAAKYVKWLIDQPREININEISIDPMQNEMWYN